LPEVRVTVKYKYYRKYLDDQDFSGVPLEEGTTVKELAEKLGISSYYLNRITVNGEQKPADAVLSDGDAVVIWPPRLGGG